MFFLSLHRSKMHAHLLAMQDVKLFGDCLKLRRTEIEWPAIRIN
jgi:hypothetical protein